MTAGPTDFNKITSRDLPAWYQQYTQNLATSALDLAHNLNEQPLPAMSVAGFTPDQTAAFESARQSQGAWQPQVNVAENVNAGIAGMFGTTPSADPNTPTSINPADNWAANYQKYMSPYTAAVVDNIARLGKRNWEDTIMPGVNASMIGAGQFGSTRNADILAKAGLAANQDILGQQSLALEQGYNKGADIYGQQQTLGLNAAKTMADNAARLAQLKQQLGMADVAQLQQQGGLQQAFQQKGYDTAFQNAQFGRTDPWTQLTNAQNAISGVKLPDTTTEASSGTQGTPPSGWDSAGSVLSGLAGLIRTLS